MKVSREQVAENRKAILDAAAELFQNRGFAGVSVGDVMNAAGLTHGAFYGYFASKEALIAETLTCVMTAKAEPSSLPGFAKSYLSPDHRDNVPCPFASLATEAARSSEAIRDIFTGATEEQIGRFSAVCEAPTPKARRREAIGQWSAMVGAMTLARLVNDPKLSDEILRETRAWLAED